MNVAVIGASPKPERYAYMAFKRLQEHGHKVFLINPAVSEIEGHSVFATLKDLPEPMDTVTMYVGAAKSSLLQDDLLTLKPRRVIFNPGAENPGLQTALENAGIEVQEACTLVLLGTGQF